MREGRAEFEGWQSCSSSQDASPRRAQVPISTCTHTYTCSVPISKVPNDTIRCIVEVLRTQGEKAPLTTWPEGGHAHITY